VIQLLHRVQQTDQEQHLCQLTNILQILLCWKPWHL